MSIILLTRLPLNPSRSCFLLTWSNFLTQLPHPTSSLNFLSHWQNHTFWPHYHIVTLSYCNAWCLFLFWHTFRLVPNFTRRNRLPIPSPDPISHSFRFNKHRSLNERSLLFNPNFKFFLLLILRSNNATLCVLLDKHTLIIAKFCSHSNNSWYNSYI